MERGSDDRGDAPTEGGWLPPEPPGGGGSSWSPPDGPGLGEPPGQGPLGRPPGQPPGQGPPGPPPGHGSPGQPPGQSPPAWGTPPGQQQQPYGQPQYGQPQYGQPTYGGGSPYGQSPYGGQQYGQPSPYAATYGWHQAEPSNSPAVAGFVLSITSIGTLILFFGFLSPVNFCVSIAGIFVSRNGIKKVERGETTKNKDLAKWGFWLGIVGTVLAALVILLFILAFASDPNWLDELDDTEPR